MTNSKSQKGSSVSNEQNNNTNQTPQNNANNNTNNNMRNMLQFRNKNGKIFSLNSFRIMYAKNQIDKDILAMARAIYINELRFKEKIKKKDIFINEVFLIEKNWYRKWKKYVNFKEIIETCSNPENYSLNSIEYKVDIKNNPGQIINSPILIEEKPDNLYNENDIPLKVGINSNEYKLIVKMSFDRLFPIYKCDKIIIKKIRLDRSNNLQREIDLITKEFNVIFLPKKNLINQELKVYKLYLSSLLTENETFDIISNIINANRNIELKNSLGIEYFGSLAKYIKIYYLVNQNLSDFKELIKENLKQIISGEKINVSSILKQFSIHFQLNQIPSNNLIIEFTANFISEYFNGISQDEDNYIEPKNQTNNYITKSKIHSMSEFMSIFGDKKKGLENNIIDKDNNLKGLVGLGNIGNTCYMNSSLQCLSNCKLLTNYFLFDYYIPFINKTNKIGSKGKIVEAYAELIKNLWYGQKKFIEPYRLKNECGMVRNIFAGYNQQDSQEFISFLLDELHEDLNKVINKPYIEKNDNLQFNSEKDEFNYNYNNFLARNQSIIVDLFYGMFKSTLICPNQECNNISKSFDPYSIISISINTNGLNKDILLYFIFEKFDYQIIKYKIGIPYDMKIDSFRKKIEYLFHVGFNEFEIYKKIGNEFILFENKNMEVLEFLENENEIYLYQIPNIVFDKNDDNTIKIYEELSNDFYLLDKREKEFNKNDKFSDIEMTDLTKEIDKEKWIKCICYIYSYNEEEKPNEEISLPKIFYINLDWNNNQIYNYFFEQYKNILVDNKKIDNIENKLFTDLNMVTKNLLRIKNFKLDLKTHNEFKYPFFILFEKYFPINEIGILKKQNKKDFIFPSSKNLNTIKKTLETYKEIKQITFKLICSLKLKEKIIKLNEQIIMKNKVSMFEPKIDTFQLELTSLLSKFGQKEKLTKGNEWYCPKCKEFQLAEKKLEIFTCPEILIIHLKRFRDRKKLHNLIKFPINGLNMGKYIKYNENNENDNIYDLFAISNHLGNFSGGHYIAYAINFLDNKWYEFDDSYVREIEENSLLTDKAYVLFYQKRNSKFKNIENIYLKNYQFIDIKKNEKIINK